MVGLDRIGSNGIGLDWIGLGQAASGRLYHGRTPFFPFLLEKSTDPALRENTKRDLRKPPGFRALTPSTALAFPGPFGPMKQFTPYIPSIPRRQRKPLAPLYLASASASASSYPSFISYLKTSLKHHRPRSIAFSFFFSSSPSPGYHAGQRPA